MGCSNKTCRLCDRFVLSQAITFADGTLTINLPAGSYGNGECYCIVLAQAIPAETTIIADVVFTIGDGTVEYPFMNGGCAQITACAIRTRTKYPVKVVTSATGGSFRLLDRVACSPNYNLLAIDGTAPTTTAPVTPGVAALTARRGGNTNGTSA